MLSAKPLIPSGERYFISHRFSNMGSNPFNKLVDSHVLYCIIIESVLNKTSLDMQFHAIVRVWVCESIWEDNPRVSVSRLSPIQMHEPYPN